MTLTSLTDSHSPATLISHDVVDLDSEVPVTVAWIQTDDSISSRRSLVAAGAAVRAAEAGTALSPTTGAVRPWHVTPRCCSSGTRLVDVTPPHRGVPKSCNHLPKRGGTRHGRCYADGALVNRLLTAVICDMCWQAPIQNVVLIDTDRR